MTELSNIESSSAPPQKIYRQATRAEFTELLRDCDPTELGLDRNAWQDKAKERNFVIRTDWLTKYLTQREVRQKQQARAATEHIPRKSAGDRR